MLEGLDEIRWDELAHAYGDAADVPELLRQLAASDPATATAAVGALFGNICHQGTVYQATAPAVPFLLELVADPAVHRRDGLLHLLAEIATGSPVYGDGQSDDPWTRPSWRPTGDTQEGREQAGAWVRAAQQAVTVGVPVVLDSLDDPDVELRRMVPYTLAACGDRAGEILPALVARLPREPDPAAKASIVLAGTFLAGGRGTTEADIAWLTGLLGDAQVAPVRLAAAVGLAWTVPGELPDGVVATMVATLAGRGAEELTRLAWCTDWVEVLAFDALGARIAARVELVVGLLQATDVEVRQRATVLAGSLLGGWRSPSVRLLPALAALLRDPHEQVRAAAARQLAEMSPEAALVADALAAALRDPTPAVAEFALVALARLADPRCLPALEAVLRRPAPPDEPAQRLVGGRPFMIGAALRGPGLLERVGGVLGALQAHAADLLPLVRRHLRELPDGNALAGLLGGVQDLGPAAAEVVLELVGLLERDRLRDHVLEILGGMGPAAASAGPALRPFLAHQDPGVELAAAQALWRITGDQRLVLPTLRRLEQHPLGRVCGGAVMALWQITGQPGPALAVLDAALRGEEPDLASALGQSDWRLAPSGLVWGWLGQLGSAAAPLTPRLRALLTQSDRVVRLHAAIAVWQVSGDHDAAVPILLDAVATAPPWAGLRAATCLGEIGPPARTAAPLLQALLDRDRRYVVDDLALRASAVEQDHAARATIKFVLHRILDTAASSARQGSR